MSIKADSYPFGPDEANNGIAHLYRHTSAEALAQARAEARAAALEEAAKLLDLNASQLLLMAGEMTAQELRTVRAVLRNRATTIRALIEESP